MTLDLLIALFGASAPSALPALFAHRPPPGVDDDDEDEDERPIGDPDDDEDWDDEDDDDEEPLQVSRRPG